MNEPFFPANSAEALAMLYLQNQDLSGKTPEEIAVLYDETLSKIIAQQLLLRREKNAGNPAQRSSPF